MNPEIKEKKSLVWDSLVGLKTFFENELNKNARKVDEPGMERFNQDGWINLVWKSSLFRRAHLDVVDARETKGLYMMHLCVFPTLTSDAPIFGFDVISGEKKMTGAFLDYSPSIKKDHVMIDDFSLITSKLEWKRERELPEWGKQIFSDGMIAAGNVRDENEIEKLTSIAKMLFLHYNMSLELYSRLTKANPEKVKDAHNRYAHYQKQNPHTPRVMKSLGLNEDDVDVFVKDILFPEL